MNTPYLDNEIYKLETYEKNDILSEQGKELLAEFKTIKQAFSLHAVSHRRELLKHYNDFVNMQYNMVGLDDSDISDFADWF